ncbi:hypothetical protein ACFRJ9_19505 [Paenarthrobacter sp. NPDC056912]|uniref:hypothetical protein n=1 Tax=Paenarthrobacter sp. NPDC056912 TaxID=3345965 RepID=UPI00366F90D2
MPYQGDTTPASSIPLPPATHAVAVIPAVDLVLGTVTITTHGGSARFQHPEPRMIERALARAVRSTRWCEASGTLTVTVAAPGQRAGSERHFQLRNGAEG